MTNTEFEDFASGLTRMFMAYANTLEDESERMQAMCLITGFMDHIDEEHQRQWDIRQVELEGTDGNDQG